MRGARWFLLVAIAAILYGIGFTYRIQKKTLQETAVAVPPALPADLNSTSSNYHHQVTDHGREIADIEAEEMTQVKDSSLVNLKNVNMRLQCKDGVSYNLVKSAAATYYTNDERLYSDGAVEMTLKVPMEGKPHHKLVSIQSSGVSFDTTTGKAQTDRPSSFVFESGNGTATGAYYDPNTHQLLMKSDVEVDWKPVGPHAKLMKIEAGNLEYRESENLILLKPWGRMTRENTVVEGENPVIHLQDDGKGNKILQSIETSNAHGTDNYPNRKLQYSADQLWMSFDEDGQVSRMTAQGNAHLVNTSETTETTIDAYHVDMIFEPGEGQSTLVSADASGNGTDAAANTEVTSRPVPAPNVQPGESHVLRSQHLELRMRSGGREIASVTTQAPGSLEFLPNLPTQHHRVLDGQDIAITYGPQNRIESFHAVNVRTLTDPNADEKKHNRAQSFTASKEMTARFNLKSSQLASMEQTGDFTYHEGDRQAKAAKASLDQDQNVIVLETGARMADATGSTTADRIRLDQKTGDFTAEGNVSSSRLPEKDQKKNSQMLSGDQPLQAQARKMENSDHNHKVHYEGAVTMWQGANRIQADVVDLDRNPNKRNLVADGHVITNLWEQPKDDDAKADSPDGKSASQPDAKAAPKSAAKKASKKAAVLTVVEAQHLNYTDDNRLAIYTGGVLLNRPGMQVKSHELRAYLADSEADSRLEKAFAEGAVEIHQSSPGRQRTGTGEHGEYYTDEQKVILRGGSPKMVDTKEGDTTGDELTYFADNDRLLVNGKPAISHMKQKGH
jgi:lipopolysaccharide export system protein LptA